MTTITADVPAKNQSNWLRAGTAVTATSASEVASQAGLDWSVSLHHIEANYTIPGDYPLTVNRIPIDNKKAVIKTTPFGEVTPLGVVGGRYQIFQNAEVFSALDSLVEDDSARYAAAGEYDGGAKVWMLLELPVRIQVADDPHAGFILAKTSHDGSSSVVIKPIIERLWCKNQINKIYRTKNDFTYTLKHTSGSVLDPNEIATILHLSASKFDAYSNIANNLIGKKTTRAQAVDYFKKIFPLPTAIENTHESLLTVGEKRARSRARAARAMALNIYENSETTDNIRGTEFALWQSVIEYADHGNKKNAAVRAISGASDGLKTRALELLGV
jgi:phage/plasmid-like protein (TIGR03299 family)